MNSARRSSIVRDVGVGTVVVALILCLVVTLTWLPTQWQFVPTYGTPLQKALQLVFVWLVPLIGSMLAVWVTTSTRSE